ncbi:MAG TPA: hypothetical protein VHZ95_06500, partial [Polyangiales bacterium]|nr:hypothetical protein [Polyangiales bacterium]
QRYHAAGYRVVLSCHRVATYNRRLPMRRFVSRHLRWAQLRRSCALTPFLAELLLYASPWLLLPLLAADSVGRALPFCTLGLLARIGSDAQLAKTTSGRWPAPSALLLIPLKDALLLAVWTIALLRRNVEWRGHALRIGPGSRLLPIPERSWLRDRTATSLH